MKIKKNYSSSSSDKEKIKISKQEKIKRSHSSSSSDKEKKKIKKM